MNTPVPDTDLNSDQSWVAAQKLAALLFPIPPSLAQAIQMLLEDHLAARQSGNLKIRTETLSTLGVIEKAAKLKAPIYYAASELYPDKIGTAKPEDDSKVFIEILGPGLFASLLGLIYIHRRINKICKDAQWETLSKEMVVNMELGYLVGSAVSKLGAGEGTLAGGIRYAALAPLLIKTPDQFMKYRNLKRRNFDIEHEHKLWDCDHTQIGAYLLKELGFSSDLRPNSHALRKFDDNADFKLPSELSAWRAALRFIDAIKQKADVTSMSGDLALTADELTTLQSKLQALFDGKSSFTWMFKTAKKE